MGALALDDGSWGKVVLVGGRDNPQGALLVLAPEGGGPAKPAALSDCLDRLHPQDVVEALCMQERVFGESGLQPPDLS